MKVGEYHCHLVVKITTTSSSSKSSQSEGPLKRSRQGLVQNMMQFEEIHCHLVKLAKKCEKGICWTFFPKSDFVKTSPNVGNVVAFHQELSNVIKSE